MSQNTTTNQIPLMPEMASSTQENATTSNKITSTTITVSGSLTESYLEGFVTQRTISSETAATKEASETTIPGEFKAFWVTNV